MYKNISCTKTWYFCDLNSGKFCKFLKKTLSSVFHLSVEESVGDNFGKDDLIKIRSLEKIGAMMIKSRTRFDENFLKNFFSEPS